VSAINRTLWNEYHNAHVERERLERFRRRQEETVRQALRTEMMESWLKEVTELKKPKSKYLLDDELFEI
jgi:hypothetical protein